MKKLIFISIILLLFPSELIPSDYQLNSAEEKNSNILALIAQHFNPDIKPLDAIESNTKITEKCLAVEIFCYPLPNTPFNIFIPEHLSESFCNIIRRCRSEGTWETFYQKFQLNSSCNVNLKNQLSNIIFLKKSNSSFDQQNLINLFFNNLAKGKYSLFDGNSSYECYGSEIKGLTYIMENLGEANDESPTYTILVPKHPKAIDFFDSRTITDDNQKEDIIKKWEFQDYSNEKPYYEIILRENPIVRLIIEAI